jgi:DNA-binding beta-propeller fold protein YncE
MATKKTQKKTRSATLAKRVGVRKAKAPAVEITPTVTAVPVAEVPSKRKSMLPQIIFALIVLLVGVEVFVMLKGKIDRQGELKLIRVIGQRGGPPEVAGQFWGPGNIRVDRAQNRVAMVDGNFNKVIFYSTKDGSLLAEVDKQGKHIADPTKATAQIGDFLPTNGAFDGLGNFYVLDRQHGEVTVISPQYEVTGTWKVSSPQEIAVDAKQNRIYLEDKATNDIVAYTPEGKEIERFGSDDLQEPSFFAVDDNGEIFVVDKGAKKIVVFGADKKFKRAWPLKFNPFGNPDIDVNNGKVYVSEHDNQRVWVFDASGKFLWDLVASYPAVIGVDGAGVVYLSGPSGMHQFRVVKRKHD